MAKEADFNDGAVYFAAWLVDNAEGEIVSEELVLSWITNAMAALDKTTNHYVPESANEPA